MLKIVLPDGSVREYSRSVTPYDVAFEIGAGLAKAAVAAVVDGQTVGTDFKLPENDNSQIQLRILTKKDAEALDILRHSTAHLMARAVMRLYENVQLAFGPTVENGFYYDFLLEHHLTEEDFPKIE
ncbi:MAG: TGS domain-containing protein, partial [Planctomycetaceae bacterium]|nr:TGS domain-containing protein [Planctomycetaceae bacterium]